MGRFARCLPLLALACVVAGAHAQEQALGQELEQEQIPDSEVVDAFARMDSDRDGELSFEEFMKGIARPFGSQREGVVYQRLPARFRVLDVDADGYLDAAEYAGLAHRWQGTGEAPPLAQADRSGDGRIDFREFALVHAPHEEPAAGVAAREAPPASPPAAAPPATR